MDESLIVPCSACGALNRVPKARLADVPVCRDCRTRLLDAAPAVLTVAGFDRFTARSDLPVAVDFWAPWCGPCRAMAPHLAEATSRLAGRVLIAKVDTESEPELGARCSVREIPTLVLLDRGREVARTGGALETAQIVRWVLGQLAQGVPRS